MPVPRQLISILLLLAISAASCAPATGAQPAPLPTRPADTAPVGAGGTAATTSPPPVANNANLRDLRGTVRIDGSSTVFPISEAMAEEFQKATGGNVRVTVGISGTGGGFQKFCAGETDISDASRPISLREVAACKEKGIEWIELPVAFDGLSVVVSQRNTFVTCMTTAELKRMWEPAAQGTITRWNQIRPEWPDRPFKLFGAGSDSGTFDYFTDAINGKEKDSRGDYTASEDDNVLVQGIANDPDAIGYFGFAYYEENKTRLKLVGIDAGKGGGCVTPSPESINTGSYTPLSRPLFIYAKVASLQKPEVQEFLKYYLDPKNAALYVPQVGYIPFPERIYQQANQRLSARQTGSVFPGRSMENVKLDDLFGRTPTLPE